LSFPRRWFSWASHDWRKAAFRKGMISISSIIHLMRSLFRSIRNAGQNWSHCCAPTIALAGP